MGDIIKYYELYYDFHLFFRGIGVVHDLLVLDNLL